MGFKKKDEAKAGKAGLKGKGTIAAAVGIVISRETWPNAKTKRFLLAGYG